jgi:hypothetical protein
MLPREDLTQNSLLGAANRTIFREVPGKVVQPFTRGVDTTTLSNEVQEGQPIFFYKNFTTGVRYGTQAVAKPNLALVDRDQSSV